MTSQLHLNSDKPPWEFTSSTNSNLTHIQRATNGENQAVPHPPPPASKHHHGITIIPPARHIISSQLKDDCLLPSINHKTLKRNLPEQFVSDLCSPAREKLPKAGRQGNWKQTTLPWHTNQSATISEGHGSQHIDASTITLNSEQKYVLDLVMNKKRNVFFTGPAGTGKSVLMRAIISGLRKRWVHDPKRLGITALTGLAACNIGGQTLHSFAGIGLGKEDLPTLVEKVRQNHKTKKRWLHTSALIIDEISMVDGDLFDKLSQLACAIRKSTRPFGGIQLIMTGDFFQLPPVPDGHQKEVRFAFDSAAWVPCIDCTIGLTQVFRQRDPEFTNMLNEIRLGTISPDTVHEFERLSRPLNFDDGIEVTELFPTRREVAQANESRLGRLPGQTHHYEAYDKGVPKLRNKLLANIMAPKALDLKVGAQVMLIKKVDDTLVNGSLGKVINFMSKAMFDAREANNELLCSVNQADTRSKPSSQNPEPAGRFNEYPVVQFNGADETGRILHCTPELWKVESPTGEVRAARRQLPLILAWALSIHKAQGQTLYRVKVDLERTFEKGQAYVALSRAVSKDGLQVLGFKQSKVIAHPRVIQFYRTLASPSLSRLRTVASGSPPLRLDAESTEPQRSFDVESVASVLGQDPNSNVESSTETPPPSRPSHCYETHTATKQLEALPILTEDGMNLALRDNQQETNPTANSQVNQPPTTKPLANVVDESCLRGKDKAHQIGPNSSNQAEDSDYDDREVREIANLLRHRMSGDQSGTVELLVHWVGESEGDATWEAEEEIQRGAGEMLYTYWETQGRRQSVLFYKPENPPAEMYHVFNVLGHKMRRGGFQFEVQWVGHSSEPHETTMESESKLQKIAPELLDKYWRRTGGRASHLAAHSRAERL